MIALPGTILSNQDGYGRMFADGTAIIAMPFLKKTRMIDPELTNKAENKAEPREGLELKKERAASSF